MARFLSPSVRSAITTASRVRVSPRGSSVGGVVERLLLAPRYHARAIAVLATPRHFSKAANGLARHADSGQLTAILWAQSSASVKLCRLAAEFGVIAYVPGKVQPLVTLDDLRASLRLPRARLTLAAAGELPTWKRATRRERAAFVLSRLVAAFRAGAP